MTVDPPLPRRVIGVAASAGGVEALRRLVAGLPDDLDAAVCVVLHIPATGRSLLAPILDRAARLDAVLAVDGMPLRAGKIYVAPADQHLLVREDRIALSRGPKENGTRPAADPLFRSIARTWGRCGVAVVLSGAMDDGAAGAVAVAHAGGFVLVQDPADALVDGMPSATIAGTTPDHVLPVTELALALGRIAGTPAPRPDEKPEMPDAEVLPGPQRPDGLALARTTGEAGAAFSTIDGDDAA